MPPFWTRTVCVCVCVRGRERLPGVGRVRFLQPSRMAQPVPRQCWFSSEQTEQDGEVNELTVLFSQASAAPSALRGEGSLTAESEPRPSGGIKECGSVTRAEAAEGPGGGLAAGLRPPHCTAARRLRPCFSQPLGSRPGKAAALRVAFAAVL